MDNYKGMRWFKCDLHMHTPADGRHWRGALKLGDTEEERKRCAEAYARCCYESKLEVVALTEHNYLNKEFLPILRDAFRSMAGEYGYEIVIFPGFELEADVGKGMHVVCIFDDSYDYNHIDPCVFEK